MKMRAWKRMSRVIETNVEGAVGQEEGIVCRSGHRECLVQALLTRCSIPRHAVTPAVRK